MQDGSRATGNISGLYPPNFKARWHLQRCSDDLTVCGPRFNKELRILNKTFVTEIADSEAERGRECSRGSGSKTEPPSSWFLPGREIRRIIVSLMNETVKTGLSLTYVLRKLQGESIEIFIIFPEFNMWFVNQMISTKEFGFEHTEGQNP